MYPSLENNRFSARAYFQSIFIEYLFYLRIVSLLENNRFTVLVGPALCWERLHDDVKSTFISTNKHMPRGQMIIYLY